MALDYTKLLRKLTPESQIGGDPGLQLRTGTVTGVNADLTVTLSIGGASVPFVPVIASASVGVGQVVQVLSYRGSLLVLGGIGNKMVIRKSADQNLTLNSTSNQNVTEMAFTAAANGIYKIDLYLTYTGQVDQDIQAAWSVPSGANMLRHVFAPSFSGTDYQNMGYIATRRSPATNQRAGAPSTTNGFVIYKEETILIMSSTGGTIQLQAAQGAAGSTSPQTQVRGDTMMIIERVG